MTISKTIYFIRHGQALHNPDVDKFGKSILDNEKYADANLTELGFSQCNSIKKDILDKNPDIVFVSPLTRTLQTANHLFKDSGINIVGLEMVRERYGWRPCDRRSGVDELKIKFPNISFENCIPGLVDPIWKKGEENRETEKQIEIRITNFLEWIKLQPEKTIAIVTHQGFLIRLWNIIGKINPPPGNCEIRTLIIN